MIRNALVGMASTLLLVQAVSGQYPAAGPSQPVPRYNSAPTQPGARVANNPQQPTGTQPNVNPNYAQIRRVAGEAPASGNNFGGERPGGNVITNPQPVTNPQPNGPFLPNNNANPQSGFGNGAAGGPMQPGGVAGPTSGQPAGPQPLGGALPPNVPQLNPQQEQFVDALLNQWEVSSGKIKRFKCSFNRWEYDPNFGPKQLVPGQPPIPKSFSKGIIEFEDPGKGLFKVEEVKNWQQPKNPGDDPWVAQSQEILEDWRCDGKCIFFLDARNKQMVQINLPPAMQGQAISDGPLPFLFGAKAEKMKARYWFVPLARPDKPEEFWLEAYPKYRGDAANYQKVLVVLEKQTFLPKLMQIFPPNFHPQRNPEYATYAFSDHQTNWNPLLTKLNPFAPQVFVPKLPSGWKLVVQDPGAEAGVPPGGQGQAQAPGGAASR